MITLKTPKCLIRECKSEDQLEELKQVNEKEEIKQTKQTEQEGPR
jgi:hypothetical protein